MSTALSRVLPNSLYKAFIFGKRTGVLLPDDEDAYVAPADEAEATELHDLLALERELQLLESYRSPAERLRASIALVNMLWFLSIAGLGVTFWPALNAVGGEILRQIIVDIVPVLRRLHHSGVFEPLFYASCLIWIAQAVRYLPIMRSGGPGAFLALTGAVFTLSAFHYSMHLHVVPITDARDKHRMFIEGDRPSWPFLEPPYQLLYNRFAAGGLAPLAVVHDSQLLGFFAVLGFFLAVGDLTDESSLGFFLEDAVIVHTMSAAVLLLI